MATRLPAFALLLVPLAAGAQAPDHLVPDPDPMALDAAEYRSNVRKVLEKALPYQSLQMIATPSFSSEFIVGVDEETCTVVSGETKHSLWTYESLKNQAEALKKFTEDWPKDPLDMPLEIHERSLDREMCDRIADVWVKVLQGTRLPSTRPRYVTTDGISYYFSAWANRRERLTGRTSNPLDDSIAGKLVDLALKMRRYARTLNEEDLPLLEAALVSVETATQ